LEGNLSFKECGESLKLMKNGKSPGSNGFTVDFYKFFWNDIVWMNTISCNIVPVQIEFLIVLKYDYLFH
jgi:hypothetical protein